MPKKLTQTENKVLRKLVTSAVESGDYTSYNALGMTAGIGGTTLYPFMNRKSGLSRITADALYPYIEKYTLPVIEPVKVASNGHLNGHANGVVKKQATNGHGSNGHGVSRAHMQLTKVVVEELFELYETTTDRTVLQRVQELTGDWAVQGLAIIASAARQRM